MSETLDWPLAYFITFTTYGTWLPGDVRGSVSRKHNEPGTPVRPPSTMRRTMAMSKMKHEPQTLDSPQRGLVEDTIRRACEYRGWYLQALNVRTNHVHLLVSGHVRGEKIMNDVKAWSTRRLREQGLIAAHREVWTSHGSTRKLWRKEHVSAAWHYVVHGQGEDLPRDWPPRDGEGGRNE